MTHNSAHSLFELSKQPAFASSDKVKVWHVFVLALIIAFVAGANAF